MLHRPPVLRLPRAELARRDVVSRVLRSADPALVHAFAFKDDELAFARAVVEKTNMWIWRVDQRAYGGDFVVVDVSPPSPSRRRAWVVDLKRAARLREGRAGIQMKHAARALAAIASAGILADSASATLLTGDARAILGALRDDHVTPRLRRSPPDRPPCAWVSPPRPTRSRGTSLKDLS